MPIGKTERGVKHYVYHLVDPVTLKVRYIGVSTNLRRRLSDHISEARLDRKANIKKSLWIKSLLSQNLKPLIVQVAAFSVRREAELFEYSEIKKWLAEDILNSPHTASNASLSSIRRRKYRRGMFQKRVTIDIAVSRELKNAFERHCRMRCLDKGRVLRSLVSTLMKEKKGG